MNKPIKPLRETQMPFGKYKGMTFMQLWEQTDDERGRSQGLSYLDWLIGQPWIYGEFAKRLAQFLKNPTVDAELQKQFPIGEPDGSDEPLFMVASVPPGMLASAPDGIQGQMDFGDGLSPKRHRQGQTFDSPEWPESHPPIEPKMTRWRAWNIAVDAILRMENAKDGEDLTEASDAIIEVKNYLPKHVIENARIAYEKARSKLLVEALLPADKYDIELLLEAIREEPSLEPIAAEQAPELYNAALLIEIA